MHTIDTILFSSLCLMITKAHVEFQSNPIHSFEEKAEHIKRQMKRITIYNRISHLDLLQKANIKLFPLVQVNTSIGII